MIDRLLQYDGIGWDFDGTLIDHANAPLMHKFILEHPDKRHIILTFRTHGFERTMFREMLGKYPDAPGPEHFVGFFNIADSAWERFIGDEGRRLRAALDGPLTRAERYYVQWKGKMCRHLDLPVLVDDRPEHVLPGCRKYRIAYLHPDEL